jgi:hypothetical protein
LAPAQGFDADGPALQHLPLQQTLPELQHTALLPLPQQVCFEPVLQLLLPQHVWPELAQKGVVPVVQHTLPELQHTALLPLPQRV